jgi:hypothetical protein
MPKRKPARITARGSSLTEEEATVYRHADKLVEAHGRAEKSRQGRLVRTVRRAEIGPFRIERTDLSDGQDRTVEIDVSCRGQPVLKAGYEQWRRPRNPGELSVSYAARTFVRGDWETELLRLS